MEQNHLTVIFGASLNPKRYSNIVIHHLRAKKYSCIGLGLRPGKVLDVEIHSFGTSIKDVHTITMYMNAKRQADYIEEILELSPKRIIFNPGAENPILYKMAVEKGIEVENACSLVLLSRGMYFK